jgi:hypothetical protein
MTGYFDDYILVGNSGGELWDGRRMPDGSPAFRPRYWSGKKWVTLLNQAEVYANWFEAMETVRLLSEEDREILGTVISKNIALGYLETETVSERAGAFAEG